MKASFYYNKSDDKKVDKELSFIIDLDIVLKTPSSIKNPIIDLQLPFNDIETTDLVVDSDSDIMVDSLGGEISIDVKSSVLDFNYCYIEALNRYYFIDNVILVTDNIFRLELTNDPLMSLKKQFRLLDGYVIRNEIMYNPLIKDDLTNFKWNKDISIIDTNTLYQLGTVSKFITNPSYNVVMTYLTSRTDGAYTTNGVVINSSSYDTTAFNDSTNYLVTTVDNMKHLSGTLYNDDTLLSFIKGAKIYPFEINKQIRDNYTDFYIGPNQVQLASSFLVGVKYCNVRYVNEVIPIAYFRYQVNNDDLTFLDFEPYTRYELYLPFHRWIEIDSNSLINKNIRVTYVLNYEDGTAYVSVTSNNNLIYQNEVTLGMDIALSSSNTREHNDRLLSIGLNSGINVIGSALNIASGSPIGIASGVLNLAKTTGNTISELNTNYLKANTSAQGGNIGLFNYYKVMIRKTTNLPVGYNEDYFKQKGRPLHEVKNIGSLSGYTQIENIILDDIKAYDDEKVELESLLKQGIIL